MSEELEGKCNHEFGYMRSVQKVFDTGGFEKKFVRIDFFFCKKCLEEKMKEKSEYAIDPPIWFG